VGDQIFTNQMLVAGSNLLSFQVPLTPAPQDTFARFRLSRDGGLNFDGPAADGEVEDYAVSLVPNLLLTPVAVIELSGDDVIISFGTGFGQRYGVERIDDLSGDAWVAVGTEIQGTGDSVRVTDVGGRVHRSRFYRVVLLNPTVGAKP
jgi:hypothetical protein